MRFGAEEGTRTPTPLRVHGPEPCASANSATSARETTQAGCAEPAAILSLANAESGVKFCSWTRAGVSRPGHGFRLGLIKVIIYLTHTENRRTFESWKRLRLSKTRSFISAILTAAFN